MQFFTNPRASQKAKFEPNSNSLLDWKGHRAALAEIESWPGYAATPLISLDKLAADTGVASIWYKDESQRFHLNSFKALGGAYAVLKVLQRELAARIGVENASSAGLRRGDYDATTKDITVCSATDGNHGRSVAWGAEMFGCACIIYIHEGVSTGREAAIAGFGAEVRRVPGNYDDSVRKAAEDAAANGWFVVSDTSYDGYMVIPGDVMQGYTVMAAEAAAQLPVDTIPTHVFIQGGVGGLAAAVIAHYWQLWNERRPRLIVVEPARADCLYQSALAGKPALASGDLDTIMAGLSCGEISPLAWQVLADGVHAFMTIPDDDAMAAMCLLASASASQKPIVGGESGVAGLAGFVGAVNDAECRQALALDAEARVLLFGSEGDTDPVVYRGIVGRSGDEVRAG